MIFENNFYLLQVSEDSSDPSKQSIELSHIQSSRIQVPFLHWNSFELHCSPCAQSTKSNYRGSNYDKTLVEKFPPYQRNLRINPLTANV